MVFWKWIEKPTLEGEAAEEKNKIPLLRYYTVFNLNQCDGIEWDRPSEKNNPPLERCDAIVNHNHRLPEIRHGKSKAFYDPHDDFIGMPRRGYFEDSERYYSVLFHELTHYADIGITPTQPVMIAGWVAITTPRGLPRQTEKRIQKRSWWRKWAPLFYAVTPGSQIK